MKDLLVLLLLVVRVLGLVRVTSSLKCTDGSISREKIQEWEGVAVGPIQVCFDNQLATPCLGGWNLTSSLVACRELGLPTENIGYYVQSCQEKQPLYYGFICNRNETSLFNCSHWKFLNCSCGIGIFCGNFSSDQNSTLTTSPCAACEDSNIANYAEQNIRECGTDHTYNATPTREIGSGEIGSSGAANGTNTLAADIGVTGSCDTSTRAPLIVGVLGGLCVILVMALVCVVICWSVTSWKLHIISVSRRHREEEITCNNLKFTYRETNTSQSLSDSNSFPHTSGNKAISRATFDEPSETESLAVKEVECQEDSVLVVSGDGEGRDNQGKGNGMGTDINEVFYYSLEKPQEYEEFSPVVGHNEDMGKVNEAIYNNAQELKMYSPHKPSGMEALSYLVGNELDSHEDTMHFMSSHEDTMHFMSGETGGGLGEGHVEGLEMPHGYEEFVNAVGNKDTDHVIDEVIYNYVETKELKMSIHSESSRSDTLPNLVDNKEICYENSMHFVSKETGVDEQARQGVEDGKTENNEGLYHNLGKPQEYEEFYKVMGNDVDGITEAVYDVVKTERPEMYCLLNHS